MNANRSEFSDLEERLRAAGRALSYPPTPDLAPRLRPLTAPRWPRPAPRLRPAWALAAILLVALLALTALPPVRAQILEFLQIGRVRIFLPAATATVPASPTPPPGAATPTRRPPPTPSLYPPAEPSLADLGGETTLEEVKTQVDFPIRLPTYPAGLGPPDRVFRMDLDGQFVMLVWVDPDQPGKARLALQEFPAGGAPIANKWFPQTVENTTVNGHFAAWTTGPYMLELRYGDYEHVRLIEGHVLVWEADNITYRLETGASLEEAVRIAESLK